MTRTVLDPVFFHGTRRGFTPGGILLPRATHQGAATGAPLNPGHTAPAGADGWVYVTEDLNVAWAYAWAAPGRGRPKVLTVRAQGYVSPDPEHSPQMVAWRCEWATVLAVDLAPAITEEQARAGWQSAAEVPVR